MYAHVDAEWGTRVWPVIIAKSAELRFCLKRGRRWMVSALQMFLRFKKPVVDNQTIILPVFRRQNDGRRGLRY
jgi:hypothetical protein